MAVGEVKNVQPREAGDEIEGILVGRNPSDGSGIQFHGKNGLTGADVCNRHCPIAISQDQQIFFWKAQRGQHDSRVDAHLCDLDVARDAVPSNSFARSGLKNGIPRRHNRTDRSGPEVNRPNRPLLGLAAFKAVRPVQLGARHRVQENHPILKGEDHSANVAVLVNRRMEEGAQGFAHGLRPEMLARRGDESPNHSIGADSIKIGIDQIPGLDPVDVPHRHRDLPDLLDSGGRPGIRRPAIQRSRSQTPGQVRAEGQDRDRRQRPTARLVMLLTTHV